MPTELLCPSGPLGSFRWIMPCGGTHPWSLKCIFSGWSWSSYLQSELWGDEGLVPSPTTLVPRGTRPGKEACAITVSPLG